MTKKTLYATCAAAGALFLSTMVLAANPVTPTSDTLKAKVTGTVISPTEPGNCFANLSKPVYLAGGTALTNCDNLRITFKCDGDDKDSAYRKFDIAQKSEITGQVIIVKLEDTTEITPNHPCFARHVESSILKK